VTMVVVLLPVTDTTARLEPSGLEELAKLGVTSVALLRDSSVAGVVLEGWAFDPRDADRAVRAVVGAPEAIRTLQPLVQMGVSCARPDRAQARTNHEQKER
jgi:hypothetical protein